MISIDNPQVHAQVGSTILIKIFTVSIFGAWLLAMMAHCFSFLEKKMWAAAFSAVACKSACTGLVIEIVLMKGHHHAIAGAGYWITLTTIPFLTFFALY